MNNDIPVKIHNHSYVLVNRSVLCICRTEVENNFLLESLAACHNAEFKLVMYFMANTAFVNYLDSFDNLMDSLIFPILLNRTTYKPTLPVSLKSFNFDSALLKVPTTLKTLFTNFSIKWEIFDLQKKRHNNNDLYLPNKNFFLLIIM